MHFYACHKYALTYMQSASNRTAAPTETMRTTPSQTTARQLLTTAWRHAQRMLWRFSHM